MSLKLVTKAKYFMNCSTKNNERAVVKKNKKVAVVIGNPCSHIGTLTRENMIEFIFLLSFFFSLSSFI